MTILLTHARGTLITHSAHEMSFPPQDPYQATYNAQPPSPSPMVLLPDDLVRSILRKVSAAPARAPSLTPSPNSHPCPCSRGAGTRDCPGLHSGARPGHRADWGSVRVPGITPLSERGDEDGGNLVLRNGTCPQGDREESLVGQSGAGSGAWHSGEAAIGREKAEWGGGYWHALVCRRWRDLSARSLHSARVRRPRRQELSAESLAQKLQEFRSLVHLAVDAGAVAAPTAPVLRALVPGERKAREGGKSQHQGLLMLERLEADCLFETLPANFGALQGLRELSLSTSADALPESLCLLPSLASLSLTCPSLRSLPEGLGSLSALQHLSLSTGPRVSSLPPSIGCLRNLTTLRLQSQSPGLQELPESLGGLIALQHLELQCPGLLSLLPDSTGDLMSLSCLSIHSCSMLIGFPESFTRLQQLKLVRLTRTRLVQDVLEFVEALPFKVRLEMSKCLVLDLNGPRNRNIPHLALNRMLRLQSGLLGVGMAVVCLLVGVGGLLLLTR